MATSCLSLSTALTREQCPADAGAVRSYAGRLAHGGRRIGSGADYRLGMSEAERSPAIEGRIGPHSTPLPARVFLDSASGQPLHPAALAALTTAYADGWADPRGLPYQNRRSAILLDAARESIAVILGVRADEVSFASSGTAAVHLGVAGFVPGTRSTVVTSAVEHSSVLAASRLYAANHPNSTPTLVAVDSLGRVALDEFDLAVTGRGVVGACLQSANHEVGTVQPTDAAAELCARAGVPLLVDASASLGSLATPQQWSILAASAHKWGGPAGVGVLAVRRGSKWRASTPDDERESGRVPGFPNVPAIVAAAASLEAVVAERAATRGRLSALVDVIRRRVPELVPDVVVLGDPVDRLPHIVTFSCLYVDGEALLLELDRLGVAVSSGSACTASAQTPSHVLAAMGALTHGNVRVSLPSTCTEGDVDRFLAVLPGAVATVRDHLGARAW